MSSLKPVPGPSERSPHFDRLTQIVMDHLSYAAAHPDRIAEIANRLKCASEVAIAVAVADQITEEFSITEREAL